MADEKMVITMTYGEDEPERAVLPFVMALGALASDAEVRMALQCNSVRIATPGFASTIHAPGFPPLDELLEAFLELGGQLFTCGPCIASRGISPDDLIEGVRVINAARLAIYLLESDVQLSY